MVENKVEKYLIDLMFSYREIEPNLWLIDDEEHGLPQIAIMYAEPLIIFRALVMDIPEENKLELFTKLLELNATDVIHGAYALENEQVVLIDTWQYDTMDFEEFRAVLESFSLALSQHYSILSGYRQ